MGVMNLTPAMRQYLDIKEKYKDCILFFRMGDFYEMFFEDATTASKILDITLTSRNKDKEDSVPLCGVPYHAASTYLAKLIGAGLKVAVCEQVEDPKESRGVVKREVVRVVSPGLVVDTDTLDAGKNNYLAGWVVDGDRFGIAFVDISTGEFRVTEGDAKEEFAAEMASLEFREAVVREDDKDTAVTRMLVDGMTQCRINYLDGNCFDYEDSLKLLHEHFHGGATEGVDFEKNRAMTRAAGAVLRYVRETQRQELDHINRIRWYHPENYLVIDDTARRNLELFSTIQDMKKEGSLFHVLDQTVTAMGGRRLRWWMKYPLVKPDEIRERLAAVSELKEAHHTREKVRGLLAEVYDLERLGSRVSMGVASGRDLVALRKSLCVVPDIRTAIGGGESSLISTLAEGLDDLEDIVGLVERAIVDDPPLTIREGYLIKKGFDSELDELVSMSMDGKRWIALLEAKERSETGITNLKVGYNSVFGYYIEVTKANAHLVPENYIRKQTLVNAERYINEELKRYETTVLNAEEKRKSREFELFVAVRAQIAHEIQRIQKTASSIADLDTLVSLAEIAEQYNYCRPIITDDDRIEIKDGRHPVVEKMHLADGFVPNDTILDCGSNRFLIITGPNMAGKSTYIRQTALIVMMAQMGGFVPAAAALIGVVDRIFTRVGAGDSLARGQSTFMVEMTEVAAILKSATRRSLILLDEVGRGTSTFDGLSIAWAVSEYIHDSQRIGARTLFATHYHELIDLARTAEGVKNYSIAVKEWGERIIFLRKIVQGGTNRSYGIQVARLAGVPEAVVTRAREVLENLEKGELDDVGLPKIAGGKVSDRRKNAGQLNLFTNEKDRVIRDLRELDADNLTPLEALTRISLWQERLKKE